MTRVFLMVVALVCLCVLGCGGNNTVGASDYVPVTKFDPSRDAAKDIADAVAEAKRSGRQVLLDVGGEWCIWCHKLDEFLETNPDVAELLHANYVTVKVNFSPENKNEAVLSRYPKIRGYPHFFVLDDTGAVLHSQSTGDLEEGDHHDRDKAMAFLREWAPR